jgi:transcriptional regulator NrdR family protein
VDSRDCVGRDARRRRHACIECGERFTTYEITAEEYDGLRGVNIDRATVAGAITALKAVQRALPK